MRILYRLHCAQKIENQYNSNCFYSIYMTDNDNGEKLNLRIFIQNASTDFFGDVSFENKNIYLRYF